MPKSKKAARKDARNIGAVEGNAWFNEWQSQVLDGSTQPRKQLIKRGVPRGAFAKKARKVPKFSETSSTNG